MIPYTTHPEKFNWTNLKAELLVLLVHALILALAIGICVLFTGCSVTKTIPIETIKEVTKVDTIYLSNVQYDSIYVYESSSKDYHRGDLKLSETAEGLKRLETVDTIYIKDVATQFRYKLLRDTIERIKIEVVRDSIPYEVRIETIKEVPRPKSWLDHLCRYDFLLMLGAILLLLYKFIRNSL